MERVVVVEEGKWERECERRVNFCKGGGYDVVTEGKLKTE